MRVLEKIAFEAPIDVWIKMLSNLIRSATNVPRVNQACDDGKHLNDTLQNTIDHAHKSDWPFHWSDILPQSIFVHRYTIIRFQWLPRTRRQPSKYLIDNKHCVDCGYPVQNRETTVQIPIAITWRISMATQDRETTVQIPMAKYNMTDFNGYLGQGDNRSNTNS